MTLEISLELIRRKLIACACFQYFWLKVVQRFISERLNCLQMYLRCLTLKEYCIGTCLSNPQFDRDESFGVWDGGGGNYFRMAKNSCINLFFKGEHLSEKLRNYF